MTTPTPQNPQRVRSWRILGYAIGEGATSITIGGISNFALLYYTSVLGLGAGMAVYAAGFLILQGFDKMYSVYIRSVRLRLIPPRDFGKTTGLVVMLNNLTQPLAGLVVALLAGFVEVETTILGVAFVAGASGIAALRAMARRAPG